MRTDERRTRRGPRARAAWGVLGLGLACALAGCSGGEARLPVFPVEGKVTYRGEVPVGALVVFHPAGAPAEAPRPSGKVGDDGSFRLTTCDGDDGAPAGDYAVTVQWFKLVTSGSDTKAGPNVIPAAFNAPESTPWKVKVAQGKTALEPYDIKK